MIEGTPNDAAVEWGGDNELEKDALRQQLARLTAERDALKAENDRLRTEVLMLCAWREPVEVCAPELGGLVTAMHRADALARAALTGKKGGHHE